MSGRRTEGMAASAAAEAESAARAASEAGRTLQQRAQETRQARPERVEQPKPEPKPEKQNRLDPPHVRPTEEGERKPLRRFSDVQGELTEEIVRRQAKTEAWKEVKFEQGADGQRRAVVQQGEVSADDATPPEAEQPDAAAPEAQETPAAATPAAEVPAAKTVRVKVDGEEFDAPADEVEEAGGVKAYQREKASEKRLKAANDALAETRRLVAHIAQMPKAQEPTKPPEPDLAQFIAERADKIRFGTPEEMAQAQMEILQRTNKPIDSNAIVEQATQRIAHDNAVRDFDKEFSDVVSNPVLLEAVVSMRAKRLAQLPKGQAVDWGNFYRTLGNQVRSAVPRGHHQSAAAPAATSGTTSRPSDKEARKASIVALPTAASRAAPAAEPKPETREETLAQMKASRIL